MKKLVFLYLFSFCFFYANAQWQNTNASIDNLVINLRINSSQIFAGTAGGELFTSINNGNTWNKSGLQLHYVGINEIAFNQTKIFIATNGLGVYCTSDNGSSWINPYLGNGSFNTVTALAISNQKIIVGTNFGQISISNDNGLSWNVRDSLVPYSGVYALLIFGDKIFAGTYSEGIFVSDDDGLTWNPADSGLIYMTAHALNRIGTKLLQEQTVVLLYHQIQEEPGKRELGYRVFM
jgi:hypothetical protein